MERGMAEPVVLMVMIRRLGGGGAHSIASIFGRLAEAKTLPKIKIFVAMLSVRPVYSGALFMDCPTKKGGHKASTYRQIEQ
jgi:hypothetical protein